MALLRLTQKQEGENQYRAEIAFEDDDGSRLTADVKFPFELAAAERSRLRWYLEEYLQYPLPPGPAIAADVETWMEARGKALFRAVFEGNDDAREMLPSLRLRLDDLRVEVVTDVAGAAAIPWELLRDPRTEALTALRAKAFVRAHSKAVQKAYLPKGEEKVRILLVICRPGGGEDVPFRSVASRILKALGAGAQQAFELDVLRPPTFEKLSRVLRDARAAGTPYHILHFDGHGGYRDLLREKGEEIRAGTASFMLGAPRPGRHGYLLFENPADDDNIQFVDGPALGKLLVDTDVPVLVLNACRSAHAEITREPILNDAGEEHAQIQAYGSLAQEVMDAGVAGVVAMNYNVYVVTAAQFVADLYAALAQGQTLGEAVSMGRKQLAAQPAREIAFEPRPLQDWSVPVVYEAAPVRLLRRANAAQPFRIDISAAGRSNDDLPRPDIGFYGRDETILALDRAFDTQQVALLHAYAGSGKTVTAAEFARWYSQTGGLDGAVLFTSFEQYKPLAQVLSTVEATFRSVLEQNNIQWLAMNEQQRLNITLELFKHIPVLWIWDNVEPVSGFPRGTQSAWSAQEQRDLRTFLQIVTGQSSAKFLLTSRRDEREWLGDLPRRVELPPMPMQERVQLARALAEKQGRRLSEVEDWEPLLRFTQGNPMTLTVLVGQALRDGLKTGEQIGEFVRKLRRGEAAFTDEASEGRSRSLGASLSYGFDQAFTDDERRVLALLYLFQGFIDVDGLRAMGAEENAGCLPEVSGMTRESGMELLDHAAGIGLLSAFGGGYYSIHPALPWFFHSLFGQYFPGEIAPEAPASGGQQPETPGLRAAHAYVEAMGSLANYYHDQYEEGNTGVIAPLRAEEANLLHALGLARRNGWHARIVSAMQGLRPLYDHTGRRAEWIRLVDEIADYFIGPDGRPLPGSEESWSLVNGYRVRIARDARDWPEALRIQSADVQWERGRAESLLSRPVESLSPTERNGLRSLGVSLHELGQIQREAGDADCVNSYQETTYIAKRIGENRLASMASFNLGRSYMELPLLRNLDEAERWYHSSLDLLAQNDTLGHAKVFSQLGSIEHERFKEARAAGQPVEVLNQHLQEAIAWYHQALENDPPDMPGDLAIDYNQLGVLYQAAGELELALDHYNQSVNYEERVGNRYGAGATRFNIALMLGRSGRLPDALLYARAALDDFASYGGRAQDDEEKTKDLIRQIEQAINGGG